MIESYDETMFCEPGVPAVTVATLVPSDDCSAAAVEFTFAIESTVTVTEVGPVTPDSVSTVLMGMMRPASVNVLLVL